MHDTFRTFNHTETPPSIGKVSIMYTFDSNTNFLAHGKTRVECGGRVTVNDFKRQSDGLKAVRTMTAVDWLAPSVSCVAQCWQSLFTFSSTRVSSALHFQHRISLSLP